MKSKRTLATLLLAGQLTAAWGQGMTTFVYQGRLNDGAAPATGRYDFTFRLFNAPEAGGQVGGTFVTNGLSVVNGLFSLPLDFGQGAFDGTGRWLDIAVKSNGLAVPFTSLTPRQPIMASPMAQDALTPAGPAGPQGPKGDQGEVGLQGPQGLTGAPGPTGATGPQGPKGDTGAIGPQGPKGDTGLTGPAGSQGIQGIAGPQGPPGSRGLNFNGAWNSAINYVADDAVIFNGSAWLSKRANDNVSPIEGADWTLFTQKGDIGATGPQGPQGLIGPIGPAGAQGPAGATGPQGLQGPKGDTGLSGPAGPQGIQGIAGPPGPAGLRWRGPWSAATSYVVGDAVSHDGSSWIAKAAHVNSPPAEGSVNWDLLARKATGSLADVCCRDINLTAESLPTILNLTMEPGFNTIANNLNSGNNTIAEILPAVAEGTRLVTFDTASGFHVNDFAFGQWNAPSQTLLPGQGAFVYSFFSQTVTLRSGNGVAPTCARSRLPAGHYFVGSPLPKASSFEEFMGFPPKPGDHVHLYGNGGELISTFPLPPEPATSVHTYANSGWDVTPILPAGRAAWVVLSSQCAAPPVGLVGWWRAENNALDQAGSNQGVLNNGLGFVAGKVGQAFNFTADGQSVIVPASASLNVGAGPGLTIEAWINPADATSQMPIVEWANASNLGLHFWISVSYAGFGGPGSIYASLNNDVSGIIATGPGVIEPGVWQHVAMTFDQASGAARLYRNGTQVAASDLSGQPVETTPDLYLGARLGGPNFRGRLDELAVYSRALSAVEILALYNAGVTGKCLTTP